MYKELKVTESISLTPDELRDLWWYIYSLRGDTVHIESALRGQEVFNRIDALLRVRTEIERLKALDAMFLKKEDPECSTQEKAER